MKRPEAYEHCIGRERLRNRRLPKKKYQLRRNSKAHPKSTNRQSMSPESRETKHIHLWPYK